MGCPELRLTGRKVTDATRLVGIESTTRETESEARVSLSDKSMNRAACKVHMKEICVRWPSEDRTAVW